jgi:LiaF transmembrane domain
VQQSVGHRSGASPAVLGLFLVIVGVIALFVRQLGIDLFEAIGAWSWPFFVIVPGLVLMGAALLPAPPRGLGFAIAGSVVTAIGVLLLYQTRADHWESWAYAWAIIPMAAGIGTFLYGALIRASRLIGAGLRLITISTILLVVGWWFFEGIFAGGRPFAGIDSWWPLGLIALGAVFVAGSFRGPRPTSVAPPAPPTTPEAVPGQTTELPH